MLGILAASEKELQPLLDVMEVQETRNKAMLTFYRGKVYDCEIVCVFSGVCKVNAALACQLMLDEFKPSSVIVVGVAGAISESLDILDTVLASQVTYHDVDKTILTEYHPWMETHFFNVNEELSQEIYEASESKYPLYKGLIVTGEQFIDHEGRDQIVAIYNPLAVDMETAAVAHVCYVNDVPFSAIRTISDTPFKSGNRVFNDNLITASYRAVAVLLNYIKSLVQE